MINIIFLSFDVQGNSRDVHVSIADQGNITNNIYNLNYTNYTTHRYKEIIK